jgi:hypothetical protein
LRSTITLKAKNDLERKEKLFNHLNALNEGLPFSSEIHNIQQNHFIQLMNLISGDLKIFSSDFFEIPEFSAVSDLLQNSHLKHYHPTFPKWNIRSIRMVNFQGTMCNIL